MALPKLIVMLKKHSKNCALSSKSVYLYVYNYTYNYRYVQDATDAYNVPADWRTWPETAFKGKCCFIVNVSEAAEPYFVVAKDEADKR